jgi:outer membrane protein assembly factor BamB
MVALEVVSGQRLWEQNLAGISTPWVVGEWIFVVTDDARLLCLARSTGRVRWITQLPRWRNAKKSKGPISWVGPVLAGGQLWLANNRGALTAVAPGDGTVGATIESKASYTLPPVVANNMLYLISDEGELTAFR